MAITLNKIGYGIASKLGRVLDYSLREEIKFSAIGIRALLIRRDLDRNGLSKEFLQSLGCIPLVCVDTAECCDLGIKSYDKVFRTDRKVPKPARTKDSDSFYYVGTINKRVSFGETTFDMLDFITQNRYTSKRTYYIYLNEYIYIVNPPTQTFKYINVESVFADPTVVYSFADCSGVSCKSDDDVFPMPEDMYPILEQELIKLYSIERPSIDPEVRINTN